mgnify:CR=1 FL=1
MNITNTTNNQQKNLIEMDGKSSTGNNPINKNKMTSKGTLKEQLEKKMMSKHDKKFPGEEQVKAAYAQMCADIEAKTDIGVKTDIGGVKTDIEDIEHSTKTMPTTPTTSKTQTTMDSINETKTVEVADTTIHVKSYVQQGDAPNAGKVLVEHTRQAGRKKKQLKWSLAEEDILKRAVACKFYPIDDLIKIAEERAGTEEYGSFQNTMEDKWSDDGFNRTVNADGFHFESGGDRMGEKIHLLSEMLKWQSQSIIDMPKSFKCIRLRDNAADLLNWGTLLATDEPMIGWKKKNGNVGKGNHTVASLGNDIKVCQERHPKVLCKAIYPGEKGTGATTFICEGCAAQVKYEAEKAANKKKPKKTMKKMEEEVAAERLQASLDAAEKDDAFKEAIEEKDAEMAAMMEQMAKMKADMEAMAKKKKPKKLKTTVVKKD